MDLKLKNTGGIEQVEKVMGRHKDEINKLCFFTIVYRLLCGRRS